MEHLFSSLESGATVLTASKRLARDLIKSFTAYSRDRGRSVWTTPDILPLDAFLHRTWQHWMIQTSEFNPVLLNQAQEAALWESIVWDSPQGRTLLRVPETAEMAMQAWELALAYNVPFRASDFAVNDDCDAFYSWASAFEERRDASGWLESASLASRIAALVRDGLMERPFPLATAGFDHLTPQQRDLFDALCVTLNPLPEAKPLTPVVSPCRDSEDEIRNAAVWTRQRLENRPGAQVGIVVPNLESLRSKVDRIFEETLGPAFHISVGAPLEGHGIIHSALLLLEFGRGPLPLQRAGMLLRSPYLKGAQEEQSARARLDATLRRAGNPDATIADLRLPGEACPPILYRFLGDLERELRKLPAEQPPSLWSYAFSRLLKLGGWPGPRTLSSDEHQIMSAWNRLLATLASLDSITGRLTFDGAFERLRHLAAREEFQPEDEGAPVQILGQLEASGERFHHLWILGLHDEAMPPQARPNPFLPLALQRQYGLPHCSPERELAYSAQTLTRLLASARDVVLSYPQWEGDQPLRPSPLLPPAPTAAPVLFFGTWTARIHAAAASQTLLDADAPELAPGSPQVGGTSLLKDMAACPFRAFAQHRLGGRALEDPSIGIDARERGSAAHKALELIWTSLNSHEDLAAQTEETLRDLIGRSVREALDASHSLGRFLEAHRLERLLFEWLAIELRRPPFKVLASEREQIISVGGLQIKAYIDRVDELPNGRRVIIDYKTGEVKSRVWIGDRPDEPQVPLYCIGAEHEIAAAAFARLRKGDLAFLGVSESGELGPMKEMDGTPGALMPQRIEEWRQTLNQLAANFRSGQAAVDPKHSKSCEYCAAIAFCRIKDTVDD